MTCLPKTPTNEMVKITENHKGENMKKISRVLTKKPCTDQSRSAKQRTTLIRRYSLLRISFSEILFRRDFRPSFLFEISFLVLVFLCQCSSESVTENPRREDPQDMLKKYAEQGNLEGVISAINQGGLEPRYGRSYNHVELALHYAIREKNIPILQLLLENGANPNTNRLFQGRKVASALIDASLYCNLEAVKLLLKYGADMDYEWDPPDGGVPSIKHNAYEVALKCENKQIQKLLKNPSLAKDKSNKVNSQLSSSDFTETITLKNGQTIANVKTKIAGDTIVVDYPNGNTKVFKKTEVKGVER